MEGDLFLLDGNQDQGLKSMARGRGDSAATTMRALSATISTRDRDAMARAAAAAVRAELRRRIGRPATTAHPLHFIRPSMLG